MFQKLLSNPNLPFFVACAALTLSIVSIGVQVFLLYVTMARQTKAHDVTIKVEPQTFLEDCDESDAETVLGEEEGEVEDEEKKADEEEVVVTEDAPAKEDRTRTNVAPITHVEYTPEGVHEEGMVLEEAPPLQDAATPVMVDVE